MDRCVRAAQDYRRFAIEIVSGQKAFVDAACVESLQVAVEAHDVIAQTSGDHGGVKQTFEDADVRTEYVQCAAEDYVGPSVGHAHRVPHGTLPYLGVKPVPNEMRVCQQVMILVEALPWCV